MQRRIAILGAAGRDFHNFNVCFRNDSDCRVVAFTAAQIPDIAGRRYPPELAGPLYPGGIPVVAEEELEQLITQDEVNTAVFSYSDVSHSHLMDLASRVIAAGADFLLLGADRTMLKSRLPVISICAVRTGCGKSPVARRVVELLKERDERIVVIRHPMPYGDLARQAVQRFATRADLDRHQCTIEEREEYEPHLQAGTVVFAGVDYEKILAEAEKEAAFIVWDGGNNDTSFLHSDLEIVVADPLRAGHELRYYPGEVNLLRADVIVINKVDTATDANVETVRRNVRERNPRARVIEAYSRIAVDHPERLRGARVLVIEDGPTLTHGEMSFGAGVVAARNEGAAELVDPRPYAVGSLHEVFAHYPHIGSLLPAMGYSPKQLAELEITIRKTPCDVVVVGTPVDLGKVIRISQPTARITYDVVERSTLTLAQVIGEFVAA
ncbi:MAG TPA: cyclic 2,3-diphosphoglycerate synthase [Candidatus Polarisedimenticolia bacterium]|nr:cyclic 2,3-diphosphoglycerate synthase [Candidatus Polarisedimenticolia bacterium]